MHILLNEHFQQHDNLDLFKVPGVISPGGLWTYVSSWGEGVAQVRINP